MTERVNFPLLPFKYVAGQQELRRLLEIAYVMGPKDGGVLVSGERGTAKSTIVRSFAYMVHDKLPVTLPINATDDRVMGGWEIDMLMRGEPKPKEGLLRQAGKAGMLYIDEVNLLDDHIINLILDVVSTGVLVVERDGIDEEQVDVSFMLVGTMNPDEGALRPQLLDRFSLFVQVTAEKDLATRREILLNVLKFDTARDNGHSDWLSVGRREDVRRRDRLNRIRNAAGRIDPAGQPALLDLCARVADEFKVIGHRAEIVMARAACAAAALEERDTPTPSDVASIAQYAVMHRRRDAAYADGFDWSDDDKDRLAKVIART